jgi:hypothetical protein
MMLLALVASVAIEVPAVGCAGAGHRYTPPRALKPVEMAGLDAKSAQALAYYDFEYGLGVLAPRGWNCFGWIGSSGDTLAVCPECAEKVMMDPNWKFPGPAIMVSRTFGWSFGRFAVADIIARFFPARRAFYSTFQRDYGWKLDITRFATDKPIYVSKSAFEYVSPPGGLGAELLGKSSRLTSGVVMLIGSKPDMIQLAVRLPENLLHLAPSITAQTKRHPWHSFQY